MVKQWLAALLSAGVLAGAAGGVSLTAAAETETAAQPMELKTWYTAPAVGITADEESLREYKDSPAWQQEAAPIGNGSIGGMVYGGVERDRILINEKSVWSGGPGAGTRYDGGITDDYTSEEVKANLQELRQKLQERVSDFTENKSAYVDENGNVVAQNYGTLKSANELIAEVRAQSTDGVWEEPELQELIMKLRGEKDFFGSYQMLSNVIITDETGGEYTNYQRSLDLRTAVSTVTYQKAGVTYQKDYFINEPSNVLVVRLTANEKGKITRTFSVETDQSYATLSATEDGVINMTGQPADQRAAGLHFAQQLKVIPVGGTMEVTGSKRAPAIAVTGADEVLLILSAGTNYQQCDDGSYDFFRSEDPLEEAAARVEAAEAMGYAALLEEHLTDYDELFGRVEFSLDGVTMPSNKTTAQLLAGYKDGSNTEAENRYLELLYYQFGRYLLIASSREGSLPANLQGIWADTISPPWGADYHTNINVQMNYWLAEQTNLAECHLPVIEYTNSLVPYGEKVAQYYYCTQDGGDVRGWTIGHENTIWGNTAPGVWYWGYYFPAAAAWMCQDIWEHYRFTLDEAFLAENFDTMLSAALFWVDNLWEDERDGTLVANPSYSPEHGPYSLGASCDQEVIWELFNEVIEAAEILNITDAQTASEVAEVKSSLERLYLPKIGLAGEFLEWKDETLLDITGDGGHRHVNHLYALHPGTMVVAGRSEEDDAAVEAMKVTLNTRGDGGTGWSKAWKINFWARLRDGDHAETMVSQILKESTFSNLFDYHPPFQIDGNLGATAGMTEMLLQSQGDSIDLLAALPNAWGEGGAVSGLKARGNFTVDMTWAKQQLTGAVITSGSGADCTLNYYSLSKATVTRQSDGQTVAFTADGRDCITFPTEAGETYVVSEIPQDKRFSKQTTLLRASFNNLYTDAMLENSGCPDANGAYVESVEAQSTATKAGLQPGDVVRTLNGETVNDTDALRTLYDAVPVGGEVVLGVWRKGETLTFTLTKTETTKQYGDIYYTVPGRVYSAGYLNLSNGAASAEADGCVCVRGAGMVTMRNVLFGSVVNRMEASVKVNGSGSVIVRANFQDGDPIAVFTLSDTNGAFETVSAQMKGVFAAGDDPDIYVELIGDVTLKWLDFQSGQLWGDVNGSGTVDTTDARLTLQYAARRIKEDKLDLTMADVNGDGQVDTTDARLILQYAAKRLKTFPVEASAS